jgi:hypothetical protein
MASADLKALNGESQLVKSTGFSGARSVRYAA